MICTVDVDIQSANPDFPLKEWKAFKGSPTSLRIRNVPRKVGAWDITEVNVKCVYPDNTAHMVAAVLTGCVWVATIPASHAVGFVDGGYSIEADGTDERGNVVTGYRLGEGKVTILDVAASAHAVDGIEFMRVFDTKPDEPLKGDFALDAMEIFDGEEWRTLGPEANIGDITRVEPYLYELNNAALDDTFAEAYFRERFSRPGVSPLGACSCLRLGNEFARAYDWKYDESVSFLVRTKSSGTRFASVAVCASPEGLTRHAVESKTAPENLFRIVPYLALDGINENGVTCCVNVIPANSDGAANWHGRDFCAVGAVRRVLDRARTAEEGAILIASNAWMPSASALGGYSLHFMVADGSKTYVVEDGQVFDFTNYGVKAMTNFRVGDRDFHDEEGFVDVDKIAEYDPFGSGAERYDAIIRFVAGEYDTVRNWLTDFKYSGAYDRESTIRPSDFAGVEIEPGVRAKINDTLDLEEWFVDNEIHIKWLDRTRDGTFWQTVHSSVYDIAARSLQLVVQEGDAVHTFPLVKSGSEPADYSTVRTNAAAGAAHATKTGNPHATTAEQVGFRVVELVVEGDAKKLYLMLNGERTTERVTSYAALLAMAKRGLVRLYYNAVGGTGRKALYTAHMVDDNGTPAMRFDATGTLGEKVYTRSIALTKSGADGIAVTIGELTEIAKASELAKKVDAQGGAVGKVGSNPSIGVNVNGRYIAIQMSNGSIPTIIYTDDHGAQHYAELQMNKDGTLALTSDIASATKLTPVYDWTVEPANPEFDVIRNAKVVRVTDEYVLLDGEYWINDNWLRTEYYCGYTDETKTEAEGGPFKCTRGTTIVGYTTANGEYVSAQTVDDITKVAEAACAVNAASVTELKDRDCSVVAYSEGMSITFAASDKLRSCEVLITGCAAGTSLNVGDGSTVLRGDAEALTLEDGDNHLTFAEYAANKFFVTRHVANEIA